LIDEKFLVSLLKLGSKQTESKMIKSFTQSTYYVLDKLNILFT